MCDYYYSQIQLQIKLEQATMYLTNVLVLFFLSYKFNTVSLSYSKD